MKRETFAMEILDRAALDAAMPALLEKLDALLPEKHAQNASLWAAGPVLFGYMELVGDEFGAVQPVAELVFGALEGIAKPLAGLTCARPMRLMYHDLGPIQQDKSAIRQRMFVTRLKPGCAEEYKRRHDGLIEGRGGKDSGGPETNFTIWYTGEYICGYCEIVKAMEHEPTDAEKAATIAWETRGLEVMDWITDDVDWIFGTKCAKVERLYQQG